MCVHGLVGVRSCVCVWVRALIVLQFWSKAGFTNELTITASIYLYLLSMMACEADAAEVYACDSSKVMYDLSNKALDINKPRLPCQRIHLINSDSKDLVVRKHLSQKVDLIVTETLDCGENPTNSQRTFGVTLCDVMSWASEILLYAVFCPAATDCIRKFIRNEALTITLSYPVCRSSLDLLL